MPDADPRGHEERVLVLAPTERDAEASRVVFTEAGLACATCPDLEALCRQIEAGAGAAVLTEEALADDKSGCLAGVVRNQPTWSDFPLLLLTRGGADSLAALHALEELGNVTLLERPVRVTALVSAARAALQARRRQYQVRDHLAERSRIEEALREAGRRKDEFLAMLGHELRNPLAPVRNALHILRAQRPDDPVVEEMGGLMERQVAHLVRLVDDLLDVSRIARGKIELRKQPVDLAAVVGRAVEASRPFLDGRRHRLEVALPAEPVVLEADPDRLAQVLSNLLHNAAKYTPPGGHVRLSAERQADAVEIRVRDNGIGIRPEMLAGIFEMFAQADRVPGRLAEGLGLGLSLVKSLVEMHGGSVAAHSDGPGRGSEFVVRLPAAATCPDYPEENRSWPRQPATRPRRILIVDDHLDGADSLAMLLRFWWHEVEIARDGPEALAAARAFRPEVVLLDIGLPGMSGLDVARQLRKEDTAAGAALVALTGYGQPDDRLRALEAGFDHHLVKPVDLTSLHELLGRLGNTPRAG
jgi:signal transduction histidine kinase